MIDNGAQDLTSIPHFGYHVEQELYYDSEQVAPVARRLNVHVQCCAWEGSLLGS